MASTRGLLRGSLPVLAMTAFVAASRAAEPPVASTAEPPPNFVVIYLDDVGYGDLSCYGATTIRTPRLDRMAEEGVRFTQYYSCSPVCTPSRAGLLTGRYPVRSGLTRVLFPYSRDGLHDGELTLGEALQAKGYATACIGKWHLGHLPAYRPTRHGFDEYFGLLYSNDMTPPSLYDGDKEIEKDAVQETLVERYTERAVDFIRRNKGRPFFLYLPHTMAHVPLHISERFRGKSAGGLYGDVIEALDWSTGRILDAIQEAGVDERTLVIFSSDNGPWLIKGKDAGSAGPLRDGKGTVYEGGIREPFIARWPGRIPAKRVCDDPATALDVFPTVLAAAGISPPADRVLDGLNILPLLTGEGKVPHEVIFHYWNESINAVRMGPWKLHLARERTPLDPPELYNIDADTGERNNVAAEHPDVVRTMRERIAAWRRDVPGRPNVVFILADDLGYGDVGCYGAPDIRTPAVDRLAREGVRMTDYYTAGPVCTPTRCAFMTGRYQQRVSRDLEWAIPPGYRERGLQPSETTIATMIRDNGYATGMFGKWHLGYKPQFGPNAHGFDEFFGILSGNVDYFAHRENNGDADLYENTQPVQCDGYMTDLITNRAVAYLKKHAGHPFFLYVPYNAPHNPYQGPGDADKHPTKETWAKGDRATYAAIIERMDAGIGQILDTLDALHLAENTLVVFSSDNGGNGFARNAPLSKHKGTLWEGGIRAPCVLRWPGVLPAGAVNHQAAITMDLSVTLLAATNTPPPKGRSFDGVSLFPVLQGKSPPAERTLFWRRTFIDWVTSSRAVRSGSWKLLIEGEKRMLFDLTDDPGETKDLSATHPDRVRALEAKLAEWERQMPPTTQPAR